MAKIINVRLRESIRDRYPQITSSLGNDIILAFLNMAELVETEIGRLPQNVQDGITEGLMKVEINEKDTMRVIVAKILDSIFEVIPGSELDIFYLKERIGEAGLIIKYHNVKIGKSK